MKKQPVLISILLGVFILIALYFVQRNLYRSYQDQLLKQELITQLENLSGLSFSIQEVRRDNDEVRLVNLKGSLGSNTTPLFRAEELEGTLKKSASVTLIQRLQAKKFELPRFVEPSDFYAPDVVSFVKKFFQLDSLIDAQLEKIKNEIYFQTFTLNEYLRRYELREDQELVDRMTELFNRGLTLDHSLPSLDESTTLQSVQKYFLANHILTSGMNHEKFLRTIYTAQNRILANESKLPTLEVKQVDVWEPGDIVGRLQHLSTDPKHDFEVSPRRLRVQGDFKRYGIIGVDLSAQYLPGANSAAQMTLRVMEYPLSNRLLSAQAALETTSFVVNEQFTLSYKLNLKKLTFQKSISQGVDWGALGRSLFGEQELGISVDWVLFQSEPPLSPSTVDFHFESRHQADVAPILKETFAQIIPSIIRRTINLDPSVIEFTSFKEDYLSRLRSKGIELSLPID
jgi:hypothetical protein